MTHDDMWLVREFAAGRSERAFAILVERHIGLVHSAALRRVGNPQLAEEVTQAVFILLARKAASLSSGTILPGWLYRTTRYVAADALKIQWRRESREQEAYMQSALNQAGTPVWREIAPLLEAAMDRLNDHDRNALLLRYFEDKSLAEVGAALGVTEDAARVRVNRALDKLHHYFGQHGISSTTAILAGAVSANCIQAVPPGLAQTISAVAAAKGAAAGTSTLTLVKGALKIMAWTKLNISLGKPFKGRLSIAALIQLQPASKHEFKSTRGDYEAPGVFVPYEVRLKDGTFRKWQLSLRCDNPDHRWYFDGGF